MRQLKTLAEMRTSPKRRSQTGFVVKRAILHRGRPGEDYSGMSAPGAPLYGANLEGVVLDGANFEGANLAGANLREARLRGANLRGARLESANLWKADLTDADLEGADLFTADLRLSYLERANLRNANFLKADMAFAFLVDADARGAHLIRANLDDACLDGADFSGSNLNEANLSRTSVIQTTLTGAHIYGCATWGITGMPKDQTDLIVTPLGSPPVHVDNIEVAQLVYLLLHNQKLRDIIDTVTSKGVLILGRFGAYKSLLDELREALRDRGYVPMMLDSDPAESRDITETVRTLAGLSRFVIVNLTDPRSVPHELQAFVPFTAVPVIPIIQQGEAPYALFSDFAKYGWVLDEPVTYSPDGGLTPQFTSEVLGHAESMFERVRQQRHLERR